MENRQYFKDFVKYSFLNVAGMIGLSCYILADTFFVAKGLGTNGLAALNLSIPVYSFIHGSGMMLGMGGATKYSIYKGQRKLGNTDTLFTGTVCLAVIIASVFVAAGIFLSEAATALLGAEGAVFTMANTYIRIILLFAPAFILNDVLICFVRNDGNPGLAMLAMLGGSFSNIILDYIFIFPLRLGISGAVLATGIAPLIGMLILSVHRLKGKNQFHLIRGKLKTEMLRPVVALGFPFLITELSSGIVIIVFNTIILGLEGNTGVAAYGIIANLSLVAASVYIGIAQGIQPLISKAYGLGEGRNSKYILRLAMVAVLIIAGGSYLIIACFAHPVAGAFNSENNLHLQEMAVTGLRLYFTAVIFMGYNIVISVFFTSTERALPAHIISLLRGLVLIVPMACALSSLWGITGVWLTVPATELLVMLLAAGMYLAITNGN